MDQLLLGEMGAERGQFQVGSLEFQSCDLRCSGRFVRRMGYNGQRTRGCCLSVSSDGGVFQVLE